MTKPKSKDNDPSSQIHLNEPKIAIVGIGAPADGLDALKHFIQEMPTNSGMAFVIIPHLNPVHKSLMHEIIALHTTMPTVQVEKRMIVEPNHLYIVPPNRNLSIQNGELFPCEISKTCGLNLPVDFFFRALAISHKEKAIGVILSGTMRDGSTGIKDIKEHGGLVIAQLPETNQQGSMPQSAIDAGMVDLIISITEMAEAIVKFISHSCMNGKQIIEDTDELDQVLAVLRKYTNRDFKCYKRNTLFRRTMRRLGLRHIKHIADYVDILKNDTSEMNSLVKDFLIGVTSFFREEQVWEHVKNEIIPDMLKNMSPKMPLRIWVPGCSTGEEVYTVAILFNEAFQKTNKHANAQIFGTDIDGNAIEIARSGEYPDTIAANIQPKYLEKYFVHENDKYHVIPSIREMVVFAVQDLVGDAPFSNLNMISCRNLLIYFNSDIQKKVIHLFNFSLQDKGFLILGNSETIGYQSNLFKIVSKEYRIYRCIAQRNEQLRMPIVSYDFRKHGITTANRLDVSQQNVSNFMKSQLLKRFAPAAVLINKSFQILNLFGPTTQYMDLPQGDPVMDLLNMLKKGLRLKITSAVHKCEKNNASVTVTDIRVKRDNRYYPIQFTVDPIQENNMPETVFLISFKDCKIQDTDQNNQVEHVFIDESLVKQLETELVNTREDLQNTIEELETTNEEQKASNEEMMSMNEELQSSNEELETSKEELQSINEELRSVNAELREKVQELENTNNDMANLINSTEIATVFLDNHMTIRRYTPVTKDLFNMIPSDVGRPISDLTMRFHDDELHAHATKVMKTLVPSAKEVKTDNGRWFIRRIFPFRTQDNRVDGLVLTFNDVTALKRSEFNLKTSEARLAAAVNISGVGIYEHYVPIGPELYYSDQWAEMLGYKKEEIPEYNLFMEWLMGRVHPSDINALEQFYTNVMAGKICQDEVEVRMKKKSGEWIYVQGLSRSIARDHTNRVTHIIGVTLDVTKYRQAELKLFQQGIRLHHAQKMAHIGHWDWYMDDNRLVWSDEVYRIFGQHKSQFELTIENFENTIHPDDFDAFVCERERALKENRQFDIEHRIILSDGSVRYVHEIAEIIRNEKQDIIQVSGTLQDITEHKMIEKQLLKREAELKRILDATTDGIWKWNFKTNKMTFSPRYYSMLGYKPDEFEASYENWLHLIYPDDKERALDISYKYLETKPDLYENEFRMKTKAGEYRWIRARGRVAERDDYGNAIYMVGSHEDITERKQILEKLHLLTESVNNSLAGFDILDENRCFVYANKAYLDMWGYESLKEIIGTLSDSHCADQSMLNKIIDHVNDEGAGEFEFVAKRKDGSFFDVFMRVSVLNDNDGNRYYHAFSLDISDRNAAAAKLKEYAEEQKLLVREIHHRVKNNLEVIISLIEMQSRSIKDASLQLVFNEMKERIWAIAYVHEDLYASNSFLHIDFKNYLDNLTREIKNLYARKDIDIQSEFEDIQLNIETAIPCGMAYIEIISNAYKHAFPLEGHQDDQLIFSPRIQCKFFETHDAFTLSVYDSGKGLPAGIDVQKAKSMGLRLVNTLIRQLEGTLEIVRNNGTEFRLTFPKIKITQKTIGEINAS
jgi:PAS domain S-box-containing protein